MEKEPMARRILVTGAGTGIGRAAALKLAADGFDIAVHCRSHLEEAEELALAIRAMGRQAAVVPFDVGDTRQAEECIVADIEQHGAYWGIVSNAGIVRDAPLPGMERDDWFDVININLNGFYNVVKPCIMPMIHLRRGGRIVVVSSVSGITGNRGQTNYSASKGGLIAAAKSLALELAKRGITVNSVAPGLIETPMTDPALKEQILPMIPLRRAGQPEDVAAVISFLCSDGAAYITRQTIGVNGGMC